MISPLAAASENSVAAVSAIVCAETAKLAEQGFDVDKKKIILKDALKTLGDYTCEVRLMEGVAAKIYLTVSPEA